jgi:hypothetical protein
MVLTARTTPFTRQPRRRARRPRFSCRSPASFAEVRLRVGEAAAGRGRDRRLDERPNDEQPKRRAACQNIERVLLRVVRNRETL